MPWLNNIKIRIADKNFFFRAINIKKALKIFESSLSTTVKDKIVHHNIVNNVHKLDSSLMHILIKQTVFFIKWWLYNQDSRLLEIEDQDGKWGSWATI